MHAVRPGRQSSAASVSHATDAMAGFHSSVLRGHRILNREKRDKKNKRLSERVDALVAFEIVWCNRLPSVALLTPAAASAQHGACLRTAASLHLPQKLLSRFMRSRNGVEAPVRWTSDAFFLLLPRQMPFIVLSARTALDGSWLPREITCGPH